MLRNRTFKRKLKNYPILYQSDTSYLFTSNSLGRKWHGVTTPSLSSFDISLDGKYIIVSNNVENNYIRSIITLSSDYGVTWNIVNTGDYCYASVSSDGMYHIRQCDGKLYISENYGNSFKEILNEPNLIGNNAAIKFKN